MHLGNGAITPECAVVTWGAAAAGLGWAATRISRQPVAVRQWLAAGALGAGILAAQMVNLPLLPGGSGHFLGGALAACLLGPELAIVIIACVLAMQAAWFGDGGVLALGANLLNMGILPAVVVSVFRGRGLAPVAGERPWRAGVLATLSVVAAAVLLVGEVAWGRSSSELLRLPQFAVSMVTAHGLIGLAEGLLTVGCLAVVARVRMAVPSPSPALLALAGCLVAGGILVCWPLSSSLPDGYELAAWSSGMRFLVSDDPAVIGQAGAWNLAAFQWQETLVSAVRGGVGNGIVAACCSLLLAALLPVATLLGIQGGVAHGLGIRRRLVPVRASKD
jgi:cobalt/nickel transport system permease protein